MKKSLQNQKVAERVKSASLLSDIITIVAVLVLAVTVLYYSFKQIQKYQEKVISSGYGEVIN